MSLLAPGVRVHFVGVGGIGLSGLALVLHCRGHAVTGSDRQRSDVTDRLNAQGIPVSVGHRPENLPVPAGDEAGLIVVVSSAIPADNVEVAEARRRGVPVVKRDAILGELTAGRRTIAVAGTHGKTTTSAMIAWILVEAGMAPTFVVGGVLQNLGTNAQEGSGSFLVVEADEYDRAFLGLWPEVTVLTTLEHDHPDCYPTFGEMQAAFDEFAGRVAGRGRLILCGDDRQARMLGERLVQRNGAEAAQAKPDWLVTYGVGADNDWRADEVQLGGGATFTVRQAHRRLGPCALQLPGLHNVQNALASLAAAAEAGVEFEVASAALTRFRGTARRFEVKGLAGGVTVVDDYAHHPTEIRATLAAARSRYPGRPLWAVFQPHTYSRTATLLDDYAAAFDQADHVIVTGIYAARERERPGVTGASIVDGIMRRREVNGSEAVLPEARYVESLDGAVQVLLHEVGAGAVVLTLGAGDGYVVGERLLEGLRNGAPE